MRRSRRRAALVSRATDARSGCSSTEAAVRPARRGGVVGSSQSRPDWSNEALSSVSVHHSPPGAGSGGPAVPVAEAERRRAAEDRDIADDPVADDPDPSPSTGETIRPSSGAPMEPGGSVREAASSTRTPVSVVESRSRRPPRSAREPVRRGPGRGGRRSSRRSAGASSRELRARREGRAALRAVTGGEHHGGREPLERRPFSCVRDGRIDEEHGGAELPGPEQAVPERRSRTRRAHRTRRRRRRSTPSHSCSDPPGGEDRRVGVETGRGAPVDRPRVKRISAGSSAAVSRGGVGEPGRTSWPASRRRRSRCSSCAAAAAVPSSPDSAPRTIDDQHRRLDELSRVTSPSRS